jgi:hypothetical protein
MTSSIRIYLALLALVVSASPSAAQSLMVCGWDEVFVLDVSSTPRKVWSWKAVDRPELPEPYRSKFRTTDDCKPVSGGRVLITASSDGAALVERATGRTIWWGACGNAHSAELLPGDRIVLACSTRERTGNKLSLFDASHPEREIFATELFSGHGVIWDESRARLWALGEKELRSYRLEGWTTDQPSLVVDHRYPLPDLGGHELSAVPRSPHLIVSTHAGVWRFDRDTHEFIPEPDLQGLHDVKSAVIDAASGRLAYTQAERPEWWTSHIRFLHPHRDVHLVGERIYKVRWVGTQ